MRKFALIAADWLSTLTDADAQGLGQLVERFRNSKVMQEHPDWRPIVLSQGKVVPFPPPNNLKAFIKSFQSSDGLYMNTTPPRPRVYVPVATQNRDVFL